MNKQTRGMLLAEQRAVTVQIEQLRSELEKVGQALSHVGRAFAQRPGDLSDDTPRPSAEVPAATWDSMWDRAVLSVLQHALHAELTRLAEIRVQLGLPAVPLGNAMSSAHRAAAPTGR
jgi:hypothetical protein